MRKCVRLVERVENDVFLKVRSSKCAEDSQLGCQMLYTHTHLYTYAWYVYVYLYSQKTPRPSRGLCRPRTRRGRAHGRAGLRGALFWRPRPLGMSQKCLFQNYDLPHSFQGSFFLETLRKPSRSQQKWIRFLKRTMVGKNGESTLRKMAHVVTVDLSDFAESSPVWVPFQKKWVWTIDILQSIFKYPHWLQLEFLSRPQ